MTTRKVMIVEEEVKAWEECKNPICSKGHGCAFCNGEGGKWHEAVVTIEYDGSPWLVHTAIELTKSSTLIRYHELCRVCKGNKVVGSPDFLGDKVENMTICTMNVCPNCHGTGCEPGTATDWMVK